jgi:RNA polymerase sigma factor for flagellar operon FliA
MARSSDGLRTWERSVSLGGDELAAVWAEFHKTRSDTARNQLSEHYLPLVKYTADRLCSKLPDEVDIDDLVSAGCDGLRDAIENFDPGRGVKFETYCTTRIRGAVLDALRNTDWVPRLVRARANQLNDARRRLQARLGRTPTDHELASYMGLSEAEYEKLVRDAHAVGMVSLQRNFPDQDSAREMREGDVVSDPRTESPARAVHENEVRDLITRGMSKNERLILILYYYEGMTMKEIGATLALSESRVSQMHTAIITRLRQTLDGREGDFVAPEA